MMAVSSAQRAEVKWREGKGTSLTYRKIRTGKIFHSELCQQYATTSGCLYGRFERPTFQVGRYSFEKVGREIKDS